jgi:archaellum component FlaC
MTRSERDAVVRKFIQHSKEQAETSKSAIQAMQEALSVSEEQRQKQNNVSKASSDRLQKLLVEHDKLESENKRLSADVEKLTNELTTSREKASQLLSQVREDNQKEWLKREAMFKTTIRKMQKELRASKKRTVKEEIDCQCENSGSTKEGGGELANNGAAFRVRGTVIRPLLSKGQKIGKGVRIGAESVETEKGVPSAISFCSSSAQTENNCRDARKRFPTQTKGVLKPSKYMGNSSLNAPDTLDTMRCPRPIDAFKGKTPSKNRAEFVRGNGGARGLQEKLRQVRSPLHV